MMVLQYIDSFIRKGTTALDEYVMNAMSNGALYPLILGMNCSVVLPFGTLNLVTVYLFYFQIEFVS
jgi:hypothetical protein